MSNTITVNINTTVSTTGQYAYVSSRPDARTPYEPSIATTPIFVSIDGALPDGRWLAQPVVVQIEDDNGEIIVCEPHFNMYASGSTVQEAVEAFKRIFSGYLDVLSEDEESSGTYLHEQLEYLRSTIRTA
jgi:predicted RNase H-like HicB family nuclease